MNDTEKTGYPKYGREKETFSFEDTKMIIYII